MFRLQRYKNFVVAANIFPLNSVLTPVMGYFLKNYGWHGRHEHSFYLKHRIGRIERILCFMLPIVVLSNYEWHGRHEHSFYLKHRIGWIERIFYYATTGIFVFSCFSCHS